MWPSNTIGYYIGTITTIAYTRTIKKYTGTIAFSTSNIQTNTLQVDIICGGTTIGFADGAGAAASWPSQHQPDQARAAPRCGFAQPRQYHHHRRSAGQRAQSRGCLETTL